MAVGDWLAIEYLLTTAIVTLVDLVHIYDSSDQHNSSVNCTYQIALAVRRLKETHLNERRDV